MKIFALDNRVIRYRLCGTSGASSKPGKRQSMDPAASRGKSRRRWTVSSSCVTCSSLGASDHMKHLLRCA